MIRLLFVTHLLISILISTPTHALVPRPIIKLITDRVDDAIEVLEKSENGWLHGALDKPEILGVFDRATNQPPNSREFAESAFAYEELQMTLVPRSVAMATSLLSRLGAHSAEHVQIGRLPYDYQLIRSYLLGDDYLFWIRLQDIKTNMIETRAFADQFDANDLAGPNPGELAHLTRAEEILADFPDKGAEAETIVDALRRLLDPLEDLALHNEELDLDPRTPIEDPLIEYLYRIEQMKADVELLAELVPHFPKAD